MSKYIGITIGPIFDTISEVSKPAALWFASSLFSDLSRRLCLKICDTFKNDVKIISPYFDKSIDLSDGVGKFHDRIIFKTDSYNKEKLNQIIETAKKETYDCFVEEKNEKQKREKETIQREYLHNYLQINYVVLDENKVTGKNVILTLSPYLDALELMRKFPQTHGASPIKELFRSTKDEASNYAIKNSKLFTGIEKNNNQFYADTKEKGIRKIEDIAKGKLDDKVPLKKQKYYAVVHADGDGMGDFLSRLKTDDEITAFSRACLKYATDAAGLIGSFGGMTIYAGGDDLLFLSPLEGVLESYQCNDSQSNPTILDLCGELNNLFRENMKKFLGVNTENDSQSKDERGADQMAVIPTISFGIAVRYYKYPLYEALEESRELLEFVKHNTDKKKNACAIQVEKHSGSSIGVVISHKDMAIIKELNQIRIMKSNTSNEDPIVNSNPEDIKNVIYTLETMYALIQQLDKQDIIEEDYKKIWMNFFDNPNQKADEDYYFQLGHLYYKYFKENNHMIRVLDKDEYGKFLYASYDPTHKTLKEETENNNSIEPSNKTSEILYNSLKAFTVLLRFKKFLNEGDEDEHGRLSD